MPCLFPLLPLLLVYLLIHHRYAKCDIERKYTSYKIPSVCVYIYYSLIVTLSVADVTCVNPP